MPSNDFKVISKPIKWEVEHSTILYRNSFLPRIQRIKRSLRSGGDLPQDILQNSGIRVQMGNFLLKYRRDFFSRWGRSPATRPLQELIYRVQLVALQNNSSPDEVLDELHSLDIRSSWKFGSGWTTRLWRLFRLGI